MEDSVWRRLKRMMLNEALERDQEHAFSAKFPETTLNLKFAIELYECGRKGVLPRSWEPMMRLMRMRESEEYPEFVRLNAKYKVLQDAIERSVFTPLRKRKNNEGGGGDRDGGTNKKRKT